MLGWICLTVPPYQHENAARVCSVLIDPIRISFMTCYELIPAMPFVWFQLYHYSVIQSH